MEDSSNINTQSFVSVISSLTYQLITNVKTGYQPRGLVVDDANNVVYVANRNISATGWTPHHTTSCGGRNGYITMIDMKTIQLIPEKVLEVSVDPYSIAIKD
jgi:DNA-binding beta-propeller fold protein YncE